MKRVGGLWPRITEYANLLSAYRKARRGKATRPAVARFALDLETNLFKLQRALVERRYRPGGYRLFKIYDRKPRQIAAAPFRDRVVHHVLMNEAGLCELSDIRASVASWIGHACHADSWGLRRALLGSVYFQRGSPRCHDRARGSRRWLEQQTGERTFRQSQQEQPR